MGLIRDWVWMIRGRVGLLLTLYGPHSAAMSCVVMMNAALTSVSPRLHSCTMRTKGIFWTLCLSVVYVDACAGNIQSVIELGALSEHVTSSWAFFPVVFIVDFF